MTNVWFEELYDKLKDKVDSYSAEQIRDATKAQMAALAGVNEADIHDAAFENVKAVLYSKKRESKLTSDLVFLKQFIDVQAFKDRFPNFRVEDIKLIREDDNFVVKIYFEGKS